MKIGLLGYGKMGKAIEQQAAQNNVEVAWRIRSDERAQLTPTFIQQADVVIEFTRPEAAFENVMLCLDAGVPVVCGTTGWQSNLGEAEVHCREKDGAFLWASNFSVGVNLFFALNRYLAQLMANRPEYSAALTEIHHIHKLDAPSGTAITIAHELMASAGRYQDWQLMPAEPSPALLPVTAIRENEVPGTHQLVWQSAIDSITLEHKAHSRTGFASGALLAAKWLHGRKGVFSMQDVLGL
ncbi:MAG TPA: 4-hydroxy-tetrahydrodipicolinate reductase [Saprospiraceae bacterium]|nr:4-hydroxy-tetrahydrodipicolinate reductase [Saprospiraceae bacterium]